VLSGTTALDVMAAGLADAGDSEGGDLSAFNTGFEPRTGYEWLSRDEAEVDKYVADPLCGFAVDPAAVPRMFAAGARLSDPEVLGGIRPELPILLVSGDADPLAGAGRLVELVGQRYREAGVRDVTVKLYPHARHEIFNEINRDQITADLIDWLVAHL
jgi:alpha-beta hydrolase superfamily lysophospholipase